MNQQGATYYTSLEGGASFGKGARRKSLQGEISRISKSLALTAELTYPVAKMRSLESCFAYQACE